MLSARFFPRNHALCATVLACAVVLTPLRSARATGHGPVYGLATPTLGKGAWSLDVGAMYRERGPFDDSNSHSAMLRPMVGYGLTEDLQLSLSVPVPLFTPVAGGMPARMMGMMPATPDVELQLAWRFHRTDDLGSRFESTALFGLDYPTDAVRGGMRTSPGFIAGGVTGYASRSVYAWLGALYRRYLSPRGAGADHEGDLVFYSAVVGYRPELFRQELPHADWRVFAEAVGELRAHDVVAGNPLPNSGGHQLFVGPTVLGLFGAWGISGGPLFRVYADLNGTQTPDRFRVAINFTRWWF